MLGLSAKAGAGKVVDGVYVPAHLTVPLVGRVSHPYPFNTGPTGYGLFTILSNCFLKYLPWSILSISVFPFKPL